MVVLIYELTTYCNLISNSACELAVILEILLCQLTYIHYLVVQTKLPGKLCQSQG